jgi:hypothetical protein
LSGKIEGFVIEGDAGSFLDAGNRWREVPIGDAYVHPPETIEGIREDMHHARSKPKKMYQAVRIEGGTILLTGRPISFYVSSGKDRQFVGDCQLTT